MDVRVAAYCVVIQGDAMLLAHWNERGKSGWTLPGGGLEPFESPKQAAVREVLEETGYHVELDDLLEVDSHYIRRDQRFSGRGPLHAVRIVYTAHIVGGALADEVGGSTDRAGWIPLGEISALRRVELIDVALRAVAARA